MMALIGQIEVTSIVDHLAILEWPILNLRGNYVWWRSVAYIASGRRETADMIS